MRLNGVQEVVGSNPASPSLGFLEGLFLTEEVPEGWWDRGVSKERRNRYRWGLSVSSHFWGWQIPYSDAITEQHLNHPL